MSEPFGFGPVVQIAVVVENIEAKARAWADLFGMPVPDIQMTGTVEEADTQYRGGPTNGRARLAFFRFDNLSVELIEPVGGPSTWRDQLEAHGDSLHHIAFRIRGMNDISARLGERGISLVQRGDYTGGRYAYFDAEEELGLILELLENDPT